MTKEELREIRERWEAAHEIGECGSAEDTLFVAHTYTDIPKLLAYIEKLEADLASVRRLERIYSDKWNCGLCRDAYNRGGCPDHGPALVGF